jgi:uncharacterized protein (TIGR03083 family)
VLLTPLYDRPSFLRIDVPLGDLADPAAPLLRQRRRLAAQLADLSDEQWATPSRCAGWSVQDVIAHLMATNQFWAVSIDAGLAGKPTRYLAAFDPVATPAEMVEEERHRSADEVLDRFADSTEKLAAAVGRIDGAGWALPGEAPPGHIPLTAVALHALWDAWVHERDVLLPLGRTPVEEPDEITACLAYAAALSPAVGIAGGSTRPGAITVDATGPDLHLVVDVGDTVVVGADGAPAGALHLTGPAVALVDALSLRAALPCPVPADQRWLLDALSEAFDQAT